MRSASAGRFDIADIVRDHRRALEEQHQLHSAQRRVLTALTSCRTAALGGHLDRCACGYEKPSYNSCRNRHCPKCQALAQQRWIEEQRARTLDTQHFHVVFTMPAELRALARFAKATVYDALFQAVGRTLLEFGESRIHATIGATLVLHTWNRKLEFHPHVHAIVTAGGLSADGLTWKRTGRAYLFPIRLMGRVLAAKMFCALDEAYRKGAFRGFRSFDDPQGFERLMRAVAKSWNVYAKPSFDRARHVLAYLGRYTHRVGISNSRLVAVSAESVTFHTKDGATETVSPVEFLWRFVQHVLPARFHKIRHIGLHASKPKRALATALLGGPIAVPKRTTSSELLFEVTGRDIQRCPRCSAPLVSTPLPAARAPPPAIEAR